MITLRLSAPARRGIEGYCRRQGVSMTAFFEAFGQVLLEPGILVRLDASDVTVRIVDDAKTLDQSRRSRRNDSG